MNVDSLLNNINEVNQNLIYYKLNLNLFLNSIKPKIFYEYYLTFVFDRILIAINDYLKFGPFLGGGGN